MCIIHTLTSSHILGVFSFLPLIPCMFVSLIRHASVSCLFKFYTANYLITCGRRNVCAGELETKLC